MTRTRMVAALAIAVVADVVQLASGAVGWIFFDQAVDVVVMLIMIRLLGFHWLLLPTFVLEFVPLVDMVPTWTLCVLWVVRLRNQQRADVIKKSSPPVIGNQ